MHSQLSVELFDTTARSLNLPVSIDAPEGGWTWPPTSVSLISGEHEAILVDTVATQEDCRNLADWIEAKGKILKTIYITHGHLDHFIGLSIILERFPNASVLATEETIELIREEKESGKERATFSPFFVDPVCDGVVVPEQIPADGRLDLEDYDVFAVATGRSDVAHSSYVHLPEVRTVIVGDIAYNDVHPTLVGSDSEKRKAWIKTLTDLQQLDLETVVASHRKVDSVNDTESLAKTIAYLRDANRLLEAGPTAAEFIAQMLEAHPTRANVTTLYYSAMDLGLE